MTINVYRYNFQQITHKFQFEVNNTLPEVI